MCVATESKRYKLFDTVILNSPEGVFPLMEDHSMQRSIQSALAKPGFKVWNHAQIRTEKGARFAFSFLIYFGDARQIPDNRERPTAKAHLSRQSTPRHPPKPLKEVLEEVMHLDNSKTRIQQEKQDEQQLRHNAQTHRHSREQKSIVIPAWSYPPGP